LSIGVFLCVHVLSRQRGKAVGGSATETSGSGGADDEDATRRRKHVTRYTLHY